MQIDKENNPRSVFDRHYSIKCPHCQTMTNITAMSYPRYELLSQYQPARVGITYKCDACLEPIFMKFTVEKYDSGNHRVLIDETYTEVERPLESFEYQYLPDEVRQEFREAATCYSVCAYNAFAAMCRRAVQVICTHQGASGRDKVTTQLRDLSSQGVADEETMALLERIIIEGHDGAHPHLPAITASRAEVLMVLMKDVLYQVYVRKGKIAEASERRKAQMGGAEERS
jgi:hypothetical protein